MSSEEGCLQGKSDPHQGHDQDRGTPDYKEVLSPLRSESRREDYSERRSATDEHDAEEWWMTLEGLTTMVAGDLHNLLGDERRLPRGFVLFHDAARRPLERL